MRNTLFVLFFLACSSCVSAAENLISIESHYSAKETADRFESIIKAKGLTLFSSIDHQKNASGVGLEIRATQVIVFGNPKVGTQLMLCGESVAIDLPQKVLVWEDFSNKVWLSYNNPQYLKERHNLQGCDKVINKISDILSALGHAATFREPAPE